MPELQTEKRWHCIVCDVLVVRRTGPAGIVCPTHRGWNRHACRTCKQLHVLHKDTLYCSAECRPTTARPKAAQPPRYCAECEQQITNPHQRQYCDDTCRIERARHKQGMRYRQCKQCDGSLGRVSYSNLCKTCSAANLKARRKLDRKKRDKHDANHRKRARRFGVEYEPVKAPVVYERDRWRCGICHKRVDKQLKHPHPMSPSLDHVLPMSLGGGHTYANTQLAHFICNSTKSAGGGGEQLALVG